MQQLVILLLINCSSTCFGCLYPHPQVRLRFHCIWLSVRLWLLWCWRVGWQTVCTVWSRLLDCVHCMEELASRLSNITTVKTGQITICSENAVWPPEDGRKEARNMLRNNWLTIKSLILASSWSHIYSLPDRDGKLNWGWASLFSTSPRKTNPLYPLNEMLSERKSQSGRCGEKSLASSRELNPYSGRSPRSLAVPTQPGSISVMSYYIYIYKLRTLIFLYHLVYNLCIPYTPLQMTVYKTLLQ
jgi:hypothetical protein